MSRLRGGRRSVRCHRLLREGEMGIVRVEPAGKAEEGVDMGEARRWGGLHIGGDQQPIGPGLCHHCVRLDLIEQVCALSSQLATLFG